MKKIVLLAITGAYFGGALSILTNISVFNWQWYVIVVPTTILFLINDVFFRDS